MSGAGRRGFRPGGRALGGLLAIRHWASYRTEHVGRRRYRRQEESLRERVREHLGKIDRERQASHPNHGLIAYWEREIRAFEVGITRARKRQGRSQ